MFSVIDGIRWQRIQLKNQKTTGKSHITMQKRPWRADNETLKTNYRATCQFSKKNKKRMN